MSKPMPRELTALTRTHRLLSEAKTFEDFKSIRDQAQAARLFARSRRLGLEIQIHAAEVKLECERRIGAILAEMQLSAGGRPGTNKRSKVATSLEDLGINKSQSSRWQDEAKLPENDYRQYVAACRAAGREPTSQGLLKRSREFAGKGRTQGPHPHGHKRRASKSLILDSPSVLSISGGDSASDEDAIIAELELHHKQLIDNLANYCGDGPFIEPTKAQRRYIDHLLAEMATCLVNLREAGTCRISKNARTAGTKAM